jgi:uncharacterized protein
MLSSCISKIEPFAPTNAGPVSSKAMLTCPFTMSMHKIQKKYRSLLDIKLYNKNKSEDDDDDDDDDDSSFSQQHMGPAATNVIGTNLCCCCSNVGNSGIGTGFYRNGYCSTGYDDLGRHTVCVQVTDEFLTYSKAVGNDLSTSMPQYLFPGLKDGDIWCLCAERWVQAYEAGMAPKVFLKSTHEKTLDYISYDTLRQHAIDQSEADVTINTLDEQRDRLNKLL